MLLWVYSLFGLALQIIIPFDGSYTICSPSRNIYTVNETQPRAECMSVSGTRIIAVGDRADLVTRTYLPFLAPRVHTLDDASIVVPGLADAHAHVIENGFKMQLQLEKARSVDEIIELLKAYIHAHPDIEGDTTRWIEGLGWDQTKWPGAQFPTADDFERDPILAGRPIALRRVDVHALWVSRRVLELSGELPQKVQGGIIVRDATGHPTGVLIDNAMALIPVPKWSETQMQMFFETTMKQALSYGLTSIHDAASEPDVIEFMKKQADNGKLPIRLYLMGNMPSEEYWGSQIPRLLDYGKHGRLNVRSVKLFTDGALGSWGAALLEPYADKPDTTGIMRTSETTLASLVRQFQEDGWQTNVHCIGDRANHIILNIFEDILATVDAAEWRPRIEHAQILTMEDLERVGRLGVLTSVQPTHTTSDMWYAETRLGSARMNGAYAYRTLLETSPRKVLPLGSDFPVEGVNPLLGFYAAVSRLSVDGTSPHGSGGWFPNESLTRVQALKGMTYDAAYASFAEDELGSLSAGKKADFVILDRDIMTIPLDEIFGAKVVATVVDGRVAYGRI